MHYLNMKDIKVNGNDSIFILHLNISSLRKHFDELYELCVSLRYKPWRPGNTGHANKKRALRLKADRSSLRETNLIRSVTRLSCCNRKRRHLRRLLVTVTTTVTCRTGNFTVKKQRYKIQCL